MKKLICFALFLIFSSSNAQENVKVAWLEKWENSKKYLVEMAEAMPEEHFSYKPTERQKTFLEQLAHIKGNMDWLSNTYFNGPEMEKSKASNKVEIISELKASFNNAYEVIAKFNASKFDEKVDFFTGEKSKIQILNLLQDHVTHHRGQIIVYLNLKGVEPPRFVGW
ncbi:MAG: DinB family protein [Flavobacteriaceae bacterium]|nr:DinB family protein [Flavobacteriaceae bacterium]